MPRTVFSNIPFDDVPPYGLSYSMQPNSGGVHECKRTVLVDWPHAHAFGPAVLGDVIRGGGLFIRLLPERHPVHSHLFATQCTLKNGRGAWVADPTAGGLIRFHDVVNDLSGKAEFEILYSTLPYTVKAAIIKSELERYVTRQEKFNLEVYQLPGCAFLWRDGQEIAVPPSPSPGTPTILFRDTPSALTAEAYFRLTQRQKEEERKKSLSRVIPENISIHRPYLELRYTWHWVPEPINAQIYLVVGKMNVASFDGVDNNPTYPAGHLLLTTIELSERKWTPGGTPVRDIHYTFGFRPDAPWSKLYRRTDNSFQEVMERKTGAPIYKSADYSLLFAP